MTVNKMRLSNEKLKFYRVLRFVDKHMGALLIHLSKYDQWTKLIWSAARLVSLPEEWSDFIDKRDSIVVQKKSSSNSEVLEENDDHTVCVLLFRELSIIVWLGLPGEFELVECLSWENQSSLNISNWFDWVSCYQRKCSLFALERFAFSEIFVFDWGRCGASVSLINVWHWTRPSSSMVKRDCALSQMTVGLLKRRKVELMGKGEIARWCDCLCERIELSWFVRWKE